MLIGLVLAAAISTGGPDDAVGVWQTQTRNAVVAIAPCGGSICGRVVTSDLLREQPTLTDRNNADPSLRQRPVKGMQMLGGFTRNETGWQGGTIYDAEDGRTYHARVTPTDHDHLRVRGCVFVPLCKSQVWTRVP